MMSVEQYISFVISILLFYFKVGKGKEKENNDTHEIVILLT